MKNKGDLMNGILSEGECSMVLLMRRVCFVSFFVLMMIFSGSLIIAQEIQGIQGGWDYASEFEKEILLKGVIDAKIKSIKGIVGTEWQDDLLVKGDIKFDPKNVPENVVSIEFVGDKIIYGFEDGAKIVSVVPLGKDMRPEGLSGYENVEFLLENENSELIITREGITLKNGAEVKINDKSFIMNSENSGFLKIVDDDYIVASNLLVEISIKDLSVGDIRTDVMFKSKKGFNSEQYVMMNDVEIIAVGNDLGFDLKANHERFTVKGENILLEDGEFKVLFDAEKTKVLTKNEEPLYGVTQIFNAQNLDTDIFYSISEAPDGTRFFSDSQRFVTVGDAYVNLAGELSGKKGFTSLFTGTGRIGILDESEISGDATMNEYFEALKISNHKSLSATTGMDLTDYWIDQTIVGEGRSGIESVFGADFFSKFKEGLDVASDYGLIDKVSSEQYDESIDEGLAQGARKVISTFNGALDVFNSQERGVREKSFFDALDGVISREEFGGLPVEDADKVLKQAKEVILIADVYQGYTNGLSKVYDNYGKIPRGTMMTLELQGDKAFGIINPPRTKIKDREGNWQTVNMGTYRFPVGVGVANILLNEGFDRDDLKKSMWRNR